jgi:IS30 family transposase
MKIQMVSSGSIFLKKTDFSKVSLEEIKFAQNQLNKRPRKALEWECSKNAFKNRVSALET